MGPSTDHLVRLQQDGLGDGNPEDPGGLEVDEELVPGRLSMGRSPGLAPFRILSMYTGRGTSSTQAH